MAVFVPGARAQEARKEPLSIEQLAERLRAMEEMNRKLADQLERSNREHDAQIKELLKRLDAPAQRPGDGPARVGAGVAGATGDVPAPVPDPSDRPRPTQLADDNQPDDPGSPVPDYRDGAATPHWPTPRPMLAPAPSPSSRLPLQGSFGPGFQFGTLDEEFLLQVELESQIEARVWSPSDQLPANSGFFLPRQRIFFRGRITKPIEYEFSVNRGLNNINLLNAYVNVHLDDRLEVRFGRFFTPLGYEQYAISNYWLPTPERSIFQTNVGLNRQIGLMGWGYLLDKRLDYAAGVFNGSRNSFENLNEAVDFVGYLNGRPFQDSESLPFLKFLNLGSSVAFGYQDQAPVPAAFRIGGGSPDANIPGPATVPFLVLNRDVIEQGDRLIGSVHAAYFHKGLSLIGEWQYGYGGYASPSHPSSDRVPLAGYYVAAGYFLTGEHAERRTRIRPLRPFVPLRKGDRMGPGALEAVARVSEFRLGQNIFSSGFADPDLWSNSAMTTELGLNWYWNDYIKIYTFWLHGEFGDPVQYRPGRYQDNANLFWMRFQLYY